MENFGQTYVERAKRLREQLANLQPIPQYEESYQEMTDQTIEVDRMNAEIVLPSQEAFMKVNSLDNSGMNKNNQDTRNKTEPVDVDAIFNNWLGDEIAPKQNPPEQPKVAWLENDFQGLTQQTKDQLEQIRQQNDQTPFTQFLTEINSRINQDVLQPDRNEPPQMAQKI